MVGTAGYDPAEIRSNAVGRIIIVSAPPAAQHRRRITSLNARRMSDQSVNALIGAPPGT